MYIYIYIYIYIYKVTYRDSYANRNNDIFSTAIIYNRLYIYIRNLINETTYITFFYLCIY